MKPQWNLVPLVWGLVVGFVIFSGLTANPGGSNPIAGESSTAMPVRLIKRIAAPALAMAQALVEGKGKIIAVTQEKQELVLEHGEIKGFMDAMTMGYKVNSPALLKGLKPGDQVQFTIDTKKSVITKVAKLKN